MSNTNNIFSNRVFGITVVKSAVSNYNADFTKQPRALPSGIIYATDKALKYTIKHLIKKYYEVIETEKIEGKNKEVVKMEHNRVMYFRNYDENMKPRTLGETYKKMFGEFPKKKKVGKSASQEEFFIFYFDGNDYRGFVSDKIKSNDIKSFTKEVYEDESIDLPISKKLIEDIFKGSKKKISDLSDIKNNNTNLFTDEADDYFFYYDKDGKKQQISGNNEDILKLTIGLDNLVTGGFDKYAILKNLLKCIDIRLFGSTFADETNISIHGPVQINHGINRFPKNSEYRFSEQIMSPFRNSNEKSMANDATTLGTQFQLEEGHYVHHFSVNPSNLNTHNSNLKDDEKVFINKTDIEILKEGLKKGATDYDSASKKGTENELFLWVELKNDSKLILPNLTNLIDIKFEKEDGKSIVDLSKVLKLLEALPKNSTSSETQISAIELCFNSHVTKVILGVEPVTNIQGISITTCELF